jgi:aminopeptidase N
MLRMKLGEDLFFDAVAEYIDRYKYQTVETEDFRAVLEEVSGLSLEQFFHQWCDRPGTPKLDVKVSWNESAGELTIKADQKQRIDAENPAFVFDLPIEVYEYNGTSEPDRRSISISGRTHTLTIPLSKKPEMVLIDPDLSVLAAVSIDMPRDMLIKQATSARSLASRIEAAKELRDNKSSESAKVLAAVVTNTDEHYSVRSKAAESLGSLGRTAELTSALEAVRTGDPRVRQSVISAIARQDTDEAYELIADHAEAGERSYICRAEALEALGRSGDVRYLQTIRRGLEAESQNDRVRTSALKALAHFEDKQNLEIATRYAQPGHYARTRPTAIATIRKLNETDPSAAYEALAPLLVDSTEKRTLRELIDTLSHIEDERGLATLEAFAARTRDTQLAERATRAHERLAAKLAGDTSLEEAHTKIEHLERELKKLRNEVDEKAKD